MRSKNRPFSPRQRRDVRVRGLQRGGIVGRTVYDVTHPNDLDREPLRRLLAGESTGFDMEKRNIHKDGNAVWVRTIVNAIRDVIRRPLRNTGVIVDLSARKQAEQALQASRDRLQLALNAAQLWSYQYDLRRRVFSGDKRCQEIFDFPQNESAIEEILNLVHPDDLETVRANLEAALNPVDPRLSAIEFRLRRRNGKVRWVEFEFPTGTTVENRADDPANLDAEISGPKGAPHPLSNTPGLFPPSLGSDLRRSRRDQEI
jgi:PAS domain S-box-containing protein